MVQWSVILMTVLVLATNEFTAINDSEFNVNSTLYTSVPVTTLRPNRPFKYDFPAESNAKRNFTLNYHLMRRHNTDRELITNISNPKTSYYYYDLSSGRNNGSEYRNKAFNSPYLYDILKTNISKIINNVIKYARHTNSSNLSKLQGNESSEVIVVDNTLNTTLPSLTRTFRSNNRNSRRASRKLSRSQTRRQRNEQRDRHRHSTRVFIYQPENYLLPPFATDYPESIDENESSRTVNEYKWNSNEQFSVDDNTKVAVDANQAGYMNNTETNHENRYYVPDRYNASTDSEREAHVNEKRRNQKYKGPSYILKPPVIRFTTTDFFYVTPKVKLHRSQQSPIDMKSILTTPMNQKSIVNVYDLYTSTQRTTQSDKLDKYYSPITGGSNDNSYYQNVITNEPFLAGNQQNPLSTSQNWETSVSPNYNNTNVYQNYEPNNTTDYENLITESVLNDSNFGLKNLSLYYLNDDIIGDDYNKSGNQPFKNNYYLPNASYNNAASSTSSADNVEFRLPEYESQYVPIHDINSMTTTTDTYYKNRDENYQESEDKVFTAVPLLSRDVEKAGMKIYKLMDINSNNISQIPWFSNSNIKKDEYIEIERIVQGVMAWKEHTNKNNHDNYGGGVNNTSYNAGNKDTLLTAAETTYYKNPTLLTGPSEYEQHTHEDHRHVIPGAAGEDYPTLHKAPSSSRFSCKNDGRRFVADKTTGCQVFIMCVGDGPGEPMLCPNGTLFSQDYLVCDWWYNVDCH